MLSVYISISSANYQDFPYVVAAVMGCGAGLPGFQVVALYLVIYTMREIILTLKGC